MFFSIGVSFVVAIFNLFFLYLYSLFREKTKLRPYSIFAVTMLLIPLFFFVTLYPMFLKVGLKDIYPYDEFWGFATEFTVYFFFCFRFHRKIESHWSKWKVK